MLSKLFVDLTKEKLLWLQIIKIFSSVLPIYEHIQAQHWTSSYSIITCSKIQ